MNVLKSFAFGLVSLATVGSLVFAPVAFAKNGNDDNNGNKQEHGFSIAGMLGLKSSARSADNKQEHAKTDLRLATNVVVNIGQNGTVHVQGATVSSVSGDTISANTVWGSTTLSWTIVTSSSTEFSGKNGKVSIADVKVGDTVNFNGTLNTSSSGLSVTAKTVKDISVIKQIPQSLEKDIFQGTLQSVSSTTVPTSLNITIGSTSYGVNVTSSTLILKSNFTSTTLATFQTGDTVRVYGSLQSASSTTIDALVVRDATR